MKGRILMPEINSKEDLQNILGGIIDDLEAVKSALPAEQDEPGDDEETPEETPEEETQEQSGDEIADLLGL